jgi:SSS family solute:Na+ symporter
MLAGMIIVPLVSAFTPKLRKKHVSNCFSCYDEPVAVKASKSLKTINS